MTIDIDSDAASMPAAWPSGRMWAATFDGPSELSWGERSIPAERSDEVLVRVEALGICGTDVHLFTGDSAYLRHGETRYPFVPGHEWSGTVTAVGVEVASVAVGQRVFGHAFLSCGVCPDCVRGLRNLCAFRSEQGVKGQVDGAAAEFLRTPAANVAVVPPSVSPQHAILAEPLVTVLHALEKARLQPGARMAVIGTGTLGILAVQVGARAGLLVHAIGIDQGLELASASGAAAVWSPDAAPADHFDLVVEVSGAASSLATALRVVGRGGVVAQVGIAGRHSEGVSTAEIIAKGVTIQGVLGGVGYLDRAIGLIERGVVDPAVLIDSVWSWREFGEAIRYAAAGGAARPKVVIDLTNLPSLA